jgi:hypothetical protein
LSYNRAWLKLWSFIFSALQFFSLSAFPFFQLAQNNSQKLEKR